MTDGTADAAPTLEERVTALEGQVTELAHTLDSALTANAALQMRYGELIEKVGRLAMTDEA